MAVTLLTFTLIVARCFVNFRFSQQVDTYYIHYKEVRLQESPNFLICQLFGYNLGYEASGWLPTLTLPI